MRIFLILLGFTLVTAVLAGSFVAARTMAGTIGQQGESQRGSKATPKQGEVVEVGYTLYAVVNSYWSYSIPGDGPFDGPPNARYLVVEVVVQNADKKARTIPPFELLDDAGAAHISHSASSWNEGGIGLMTDLNPGVRKTGYVVFDVPRDRSYRLKVSGGYWSSKTALIELSPN